MNDKRPILRCLILLTLAFIWCNSLMPAGISSAISGTVQRLLPTLPDSGTGDHLVRKLAHGTEYLILGIELAVYLRYMLRRPRSLLFLCGLSAAFLDETIQLFVSGRSGEIRDMWIDLGGFVFGVLLVVLLNVLRKKQGISKQTPL